MTCCPTCGTALGSTVEYGRLRLEEAPYKVFVDGEQINMPITHIRLLLLLARRGSASRSDITNICAGPNVTDIDNVVAVQVCKLRKRIRQYGVNIKPLHGWGYELC